MKNRLTIITLCTLLSFSMQAQEKNITIKYKQILNLTPNVQPDSLGIDISLIHNGKESFYVYNRIENDSITDDRVITIKERIDALNTRRTTKDRTGVGIYKNFDSSYVITRAIVAKTGYLIKENMPKFNWKIENQKKKINGYECQKASVFHKGRTYEAWFTTQIPISDGPWKFHGLPGLILEVRDSEKKIEIYCRDITLNDEKTTFKKPIVGIFIANEKELNLLKKRIDEDIMRKVQSSLPKDGQMGFTINEAELIEKDN